MEAGTFIIYLLLRAGLSLAIAQLGKNRRIGTGGGFALSFFLGPIIALIFILSSKKVDRAWVNEG